MTNAKKIYRNRPILTTLDIEKMLVEANKINDEYRRLRVKALIGLLKIFGKRRSEISRLKIIDLIIADNYLNITWTISKKHKRGFYQFVKLIKSQINKGQLPNNYLISKQYSDLIAEHKAWTLTQEGFRIKEDTRIKNIIADNSYAKLIIEYLEFMKKKHPDSKYLFPRNIYSFGNLMMVDPNTHLSGSQLLRMIKAVDPECWCHLFRETKGAEIARKYGNDLAGITKVRDTLDLEEEATAYRYTRRYAVQTMDNV